LSDFTEAFLAIGAEILMLQSMLQQDGDVLKSSPSPDRQHRGRWMNLPTCALMKYGELRW